MADDGSGDAIAAVVRRARTDFAHPILHVWHPDRGFRKTRILNRAVQAADFPYLLFTDGDCIPREDLVAVHRDLARTGRFVAGGYLKLPIQLSRALGTADVREGRVFDPG